MRKPAFSYLHLPTVTRGLLLAGASLALGCATTQRSTEQAGTAVAAPAVTPPMPTPEPKRIAVPLIEYRLAPEQILERSANAELECEQKLRELVALPDAQRTFANTLEALEQAVASYSDAAQRLGILKDVHPDEKVREAAATAEENAGKYLVKLASRRDLYGALKAWQAAAGQTERLDAQQARLLEITLRDFRRNGLELPDDKLAQLVQIRTRLTELSTEFSRNLNENTDSIEVSEKELAGLPAALVERLAKTTDGKRRVVSTKYPDYFPFMDNAKSGEARRRLFVAFQSREARRNLPLLAEAIKLRDEEAKLLGYATHADFVTEDQMAKNAHAVAGFLSSIQGKLRIKRDADYAKMTALKRAETGDKKAHIEPWDVAYYLNQIKKRDYALDTEKIREYFPAQTALDGMFRVYETVLSVDIRKVPNADTWAPEVDLYEIRDRPSGEFLAYFYTDLFPRKGKYGHAASAPVTVARQVGGVYHAPIAVLLGNFNPPSNGRPSLLAHDEVKTLFHEFGHIVHQTLTTARYGSQAGTAVARDFVEAPSQVLENWVYEKPVLDMMSGHFQDPSKKLPLETVEKIREARAFDSGYRYTRQVFLASFDQALHTSGAVVDVDAVDRKLFTDILGLSAPKETHFGATFGHLMGGYDAGYYGYLWAEVFADDLFTRFKAEGVLNPAVGRAYRDIILAKGRSEEPDQLLQQFLGRAPSNEAFLQKIGIQ